jgi:hypothetical protein
MSSNSTNPVGVKPIDFYQAILRGIYPGVMVQCPGNIVVGLNTRRTACNRIMRRCEPTNTDFAKTMRVLYKCECGFAGTIKEVDFDSSIEQASLPSLS